MGTPITIITVDDFKGDQWRLIPAVAWKHQNGMFLSWWRVISGPIEMRWYDMIPVPVFTEWWI